MNQPPCKKRCQFPKQQRNIMSRPRFTSETARAAAIKCVQAGLAYRFTPHAAREAALRANRMGVTHRFTSETSRAAVRKRWAAFYSAQGKREHSERMVGKDPNGHPQGPPPPKCPEQSTPTPAPGLPRSKYWP